MPSGCCGDKEASEGSYLSRERGSWFFLCCLSDALLRTCLYFWLTLYLYLLSSTLHSSPLPEESSFLDSQSFLCPVLSPLFDKSPCCLLSLPPFSRRVFFFTLVSLFLLASPSVCGELCEAQSASWVLEHRAGGEREWGESERKRERGRWSGSAETHTHTHTHSRSVWIDTHSRTCSCCTAETNPHTPKHRREKKGWAQCPALLSPLFPGDCRSFFVSLPVFFF